MKFDTKTWLAVAFPAQLSSWHCHRRGASEGPHCVPRMRRLPCLDIGVFDLLVLRLVDVFRAMDKGGLILDQGPPEGAGAAAHWCWWEEKSESGRWWCSLARQWERRWDGIQVSSMGEEWRYWVMGLPLGEFLVRVV